MCASHPLARKIKRVQVAVKGADVDHATHHCWRGADAVSSLIGPFLRPGCGIEGVHVVVIGADVDHAIDHLWRGGDGVSCLVDPLLR
jgi:hypothetical protein